LHRKHSSLDFVYDFFSFHNFTSLCTEKIFDKKALIPNSFTKFWSGYSIEG